MTKRNNDTTRTTSKSGMSSQQLRQAVKDVVREEIGRALEQLAGALPDRSAPVSRSLIGDLRSIFPVGTCPVCKCPDYRWLPIEDRTPLQFGRLLGIVYDPTFPNVKPKPTHEWVCAHCSADTTFLQGPVMWDELLDLRESVVVDNLSYEDFCKQELRLFERYMTPEDIEFSDEMANLAADASFTVEYDGQHRSLRTGLIIRRFQILQILHGRTPQDHERLRRAFGGFR